MFEDILRYWLSGGVYQKKKTGGAGCLSKCLKTFYGTGYLEAFIKRRKLGVLVIGKRLLKKKRAGGGGLRY